VKAVRRVVLVDGAGLAAWTEPWDGLVQEVRDGDGFACASGPFRSYRRTVEVHPHAGGHEVVSTAEFRLALPYFNWLLAVPVLFALRAPGAPLPWWGPADRLDARATTVLGTLCLASLVTGYLGTSMTQAITYAADDFGLHGDRPQSVALAAARLAVVLAVALVWLADRQGRRRLLLLTTAGGCLASATTALAPNIVGFTAAQIVTRGFSTAIGVLVLVVAAEEMPAGARAFGVSVIGMSAGLGAGICVLALPVADVGDAGWRVLFVLPLVALVAVWDMRRRLPESKRFTAAHAAAKVMANRDRLILLAASAFLLQLFTAPASQLQNEFLRDERNYSALGITLFTICTNTPVGIGIIGGGRLADAHGRRVVGAVGLVGGVGGTVVMYLVHGPTMWLVSLVASVIGGATLPALGVYGPELFPTGARGRANGVLVVAGVAGSAIGLLTAGSLSDSFGGLGRALAVLAIGPALLAVLILLRYPETARLELEDLNPEDRNDETASTTA
jgi:MFS family permease